MTKPSAPKSRRTKPDRGAQAAGAGRAKPAGPERRGEQELGPRRERYLVASLAPGLPGSFAPGGVAPIDPKKLLGQLEADRAITVRRVISAQSASHQSGGAAPGRAFPDVAVVEMDADRAAMLAATAQLWVEPDLPLQYGTPTFGGDLPVSDPGVVPVGDDTTIAFEVRGSDGSPLPAAEVYVMSGTLPVRGVTGNDGRVELAVPASAVETVAGVYVKPKFDYWSTWHARPALSGDGPNLVTCPALVDSFPNFKAGRELDSWVRRAMRFDGVPPNFRGAGVKIAIIDSGAAVGHPDLADRFAGGRDVVGQSDDGWQDDPLGNGSHCAGIIGGRDNGSGILGIAPESELHACTVFPGGRCSDLIEALDYCIANSIDVVCLSLGSTQPSELVAGKIEQARQAGVACVVAAGNSAGPMSFPASMASVLTVGAIGKLGEFPPESYHATHIFGGPTPEGYFSARFTSYGPTIDVVAPGVAVVSSMPPENYAVRDGTSFAAACVTGLAALVLAHHPEFRTLFGGRDAARVDRLHGIIRSSCRPLPLGAPQRSGFGLPDAVLALNLPAPAVTSTMAPSPMSLQLTTLRSAMTHAGLAFGPPPSAG